MTSYTGPHTPVLDASPRRSRSAAQVGTVDRMDAQVTVRFDDAEEARWFARAASGHLVRLRDEVAQLRDGGGDLEMRALRVSAEWALSREALAAGLTGAEPAPGSADAWVAFGARVLEERIAAWQAATAGPPFRVAMAPVVREGVIADATSVVDQVPHLDADQHGIAVAARVLAKVLTAADDASLHPLGGPKRAA